MLHKSNILTEPQSDAFEDNLIELLSKYDMFSEAEAIEIGRQIHIKLGGEEEDFNPKFVIMYLDEIVRKGGGLAKSLVGKTYNWI